MADQQDIQHQKTPKAQQQQGCTIDEGAANLTAESQDIQHQTTPKPRAA